MLLHQRLFVPVGRQVKLKLNRLRGRVHRAYVTEHLAVIADGGGAGASGGDDLRARHLGTGGRQADRRRRDRGAVELRAAQRLHYGSCVAVVVAAAAEQARDQCSGEDGGKCRLFRFMLAALRR